MDTIDIVKAQLRAHEENLDYVLATVIETDGGTTRTEGKMMVYSSGQTLGTVGGGTMESLVIRDALEALKTGEGGIRSYDLNSQAAAEGLACGGAMKVFLELYKNRPTLVMCGAGHVGSAVIKVARFLGFHVILLDNREEELIGESIALANRFVPVKDYKAGLESLEVAPGAFYVIAGPNHACDGDSLAGALRKNGAYVGMIGSQKKISALFQKLKDAGFSQQELDSVHTPIGLDIAGERPEEIAIAIMAEVLMVLNGKENPLK